MPFSDTLLNKEGLSLRIGESGAGHGAGGRTEPPGRSLVQGRGILGRGKSPARALQEGDVRLMDGKLSSTRRLPMTDRKTRLKPSTPRREDLQGVTRRAREFGDRLAGARPGRTFSDSAEIVRADRDSRL